MFKLWIYTVISIIFLVLISIFFSFKSLMTFFIYSEVYWMFFYLLCLVSGSETGVSSFVFMSFLILYIAAMEVIFLAIFVSIKLK